MAHDVFRVASFRARGNCSGSVLVLLASPPKRRMRSLPRNPSLAAYAFGLAAGFFAAACVIHTTEAPPRGVVVSGPPPAPMREDRPAPPTPHATWIAGYWHWNGMQYAWIPGHWEAPPPGASWLAPKVSTTPDGRFVYEPGEWRKPKGTETKSGIR